MIYSRTLIPTLCLLAVAANAQTPPPPPATPRAPVAWDIDAPTPAAAPAPPAEWDAPTPPAPPRPARAPRPAPAAWPTPPALFAPQAAPPAPAAPPTPRAAPPTPRAAPAPPLPPRAFNLNDNPDFDFHFDYQFDDQIKQQMDEARYQLKNLDLDGINEKIKAEFQYKSFDIQDMNEKIKAMTKDYAQLGAKFSSDLAGKYAFMPQIARGRNQSDDRLYDSGKQALDNYHWDEAVEAFTLVASRGGSRADGALYWKAYAQNKLGKRAEATAAIADLKKTYASSKWLDDAKALELEIQQSGNRPVTPESQQDEELKLLALNGIMQSDPERALPLVETLLKSSQSLKIRKQAVYVLAQSPSPKAQQLLEQVVRGTSANPDLQVNAIRYFGERRKVNGGQVLSEVYGFTSDNYVKRAVINAFRSYRDKDRLLNIAKSEKTQELRFEAIGALRDLGGTQVDLWQLYQTETTPEGKQQILEMIPSAGNTDKIVELAKNEKDIKVRRYAIQKLGNERNVTAGDALVSIYASETDQDVKRSIIDALSNQHNAKAMVAAAKTEKDTRMQQRIVERLAGMRSPEATEYLMELLKK